MPIFVSRFSPERSLIGSFVALGSRRNETPERSATETPTSAASSGTSPQGADLAELARALRSPDLTTQVPTQDSSTRSASVTVSDPSAEVSTESTSTSIGSLTLLDQLRLRASSPIQDSPVDEPAPAVENPVDSPTPPPSVGVENRLGPLAERLRALTDELTANRSAEAPAIEAPAADVVSQQATENQSANAAAAEENLDNLIIALQEEGAAEAPAAGADPEPTIDAEAIATAIAQQEATLVSRDTQEQRLREGLQTIAAGLQADAAIQSRQNVDQTTRNAEAASEVKSRREVQQNQREIQSLQGDRRAAQQDLRSADRAIRQLQSRNIQIQSDSAQTANPGTSLDVLAQ
ncbi:TPA: hypothetical protein DCE37_11880 [Candidatus Latescibacteria bacterium]|nr:hypothetical protein [Candidatus Latescibacterota bacterium]